MAHMQHVCLPGLNLSLQFLNSLRASWMCRGIFSHNLAKPGPVSTSCIIKLSCDDKYDSIRLVSFKQ